LQKSDSRAELHECFLSDCDQFPLIDVLNRSSYISGRQFDVLNRYLAVSNRRCDVLNRGFGISNGSAVLLNRRSVVLSCGPAVLNRESGMFELFADILDSHFGVRSLLVVGWNGATFAQMTATLQEIHRDPAILDRAISRRERLDILTDGELAATLMPAMALSVEEARRVMRERFAAPDWEFSVGTPMSRDERNARG
jgi:hypothetical protein